MTADAAWLGPGGRPVPSSAIMEDGVRAARTLGPLRDIIPSHPHMFGLQSAWSAGVARRMSKHVRRYDYDRP